MWKAIICQTLLVGRCCHVTFGQMGAHIKQKTGMEILLVDVYEGELNKVQKKECGVNERTLVSCCTENHQTGVLWNHVFFYR